MKFQRHPCKVLAALFFPGAGAHAQQSLDSMLNMSGLKDGPPGVSNAARYSLGWAEISATWADGAVLHHAGSNGKNFSHIWVDSKRDFAIVIVTNIGNAKQADAFFSILPALFARYGS